MPSPERPRFKYKAARQWSKSLLVSRVMWSRSVSVMQHLHHVLICRIDMCHANHLFVARYWPIHWPTHLYLINFMSLDVGPAYWVSKKVWQKLMPTTWVHWSMCCDTTMSLFVKLHLPTSLMRPSPFTPIPFPSIKIVANNQIKLDHRSLDQWLCTTIKPYYDLNARTQLTR